MPSITITARTRIRGLLIARLFGHSPGSIGRWARRCIRIDVRVGRGPWEEIGR